jgi:hypothetical protein
MSTATPAGPVLIAVDPERSHGGIGLACVVMSPPGSCRVTASALRRAVRGAVAPVLPPWSRSLASRSERLAHAPEYLVTPAPDHRVPRRHRLGPRRRGRGRNLLGTSAKSDVCDARVSDRDRSICRDFPAAVGQSSLSENRGVPGSSPGLAPGERPHLRTFSLRRWWCSTARSGVIRLTSSSKAVPWERSTRCSSARRRPSSSSSRRARPGS